MCVSKILLQVSELGIELNALNVSAIQKANFNFNYYTSFNTMFMKIATEVKNIDI